MSKKQTTNPQWEMILDHMSKHPNFARGVPVFGNNKKEIEDLWEELTIKLNAIGPPQRESKDWKKVWADLRVRTKKKVAENKLKINGTGGGVNTQVPLSSIEQACDLIVFASKAVCPTGEICGLDIEPTLKAAQSSKCADAQITSQDADQIKGCQEFQENNEFKIQVHGPLKRKIFSETGSQKVQKGFEFDSLNLLKEQLNTQKEMMNAVQTIASAANRIADALEALADWAK